MAITKVGFVGLGLMGGSLAIALRKISKELLLYRFRP